MNQPDQVFYYMPVDSIAYDVAIRIRFIIWLLTSYTVFKQANMNMFISNNGFYIYICPIKM